MSVELLLAQKYTNNSINPNLRIHILSKRIGGCTDVLNFGTVTFLCCVGG